MACGIEAFQAEGFRAGMSLSGLLPRKPMREKVAEEKPPQLNNQNGRMPESGHGSKGKAGSIFLCCLEIKAWGRLSTTVVRIGFFLARLSLASGLLAGVEAGRTVHCEIPASWLGLTVISTSQTFPSDFSCFL